MDEYHIWFDKNEIQGNYEFSKKIETKDKLSASMKKYINSFITLK